MLENKGEREVVLLDLCRHDVSLAVAEAFRLDKLVLCSVTYEGGLFPAMDKFLHHLSAKNFKGRMVGLIENGSWAPVAARQMAEVVSKMKDMKLAEPVVTLRGNLHASDTDTLLSLAEALVQH